MKPIQFFTHQNTVWYNLSDYVQLLLDTQTIRPLRPTSLYKRKRPSKPIYDVLLDKVNRMNSAYQRQQNGTVYVDWVVFEHLYRFLHPFLVNPDDWRDPNSLFRQLQLVIDRPRRLSQEFHPETMATYFTELPSSWSDNLPPDD